jgi:cystathionine beta-synthase
MSCVHLLAFLLTHRLAISVRISYCLLQSALYHVYLAVSERLRRDIPGGVILDQYTNVHNPFLIKFLVTSLTFLPLQPQNALSHELTTAPEIIDAIITSSTSDPRPSSGKLDVFVASTGTGGTLTGVAHAVKKGGHNPACKIVGVDVVGKLFNDVRDFTDTGSTERVSPCRPPRT